MSTLLRARAQENGDTRFVNCGRGWRTFAEVDADTDRVAGGLAALGVASRDRVGQIAENRDEFIDVLLGCSKIGAVNVAFNTYLKGEFLRYQLLDCRPTVMFVDGAGWRAVATMLDDLPQTRFVLLDEESDASAHPRAMTYQRFLEQAGPVPSVESGPQDLLGIIYTSGTTGPAKGCMLSNGYYTNVPGAYLQARRILPGDRVFTTFPLFHTAGQVIVLMLGLIGPVELVIESSFHASTFMKSAQDAGATVLWGVGAMAHALLAQPPSPDDASNSFRLAQFQPLDAEQQIAFEQRFATPFINEGYGQTECIPITSGRAWEPRRRASLGRPVDHLEVRLVDEHDEEVAVGEVGEIAVRPRRPEVMFSGYWNNADATVRTFRNFWHHTGDLARQDADGFLYFVDRRQDALRRRGENISSVELETSILAHPKVHDVAVHAVPSDFGEDEVKAVLVLVEGQDVAPTELFDFFRDNLPYFAIPRYVEIMSDLPRGTQQKVLKRALRERGVTESTWDFTTMNLQVARHDVADLRRPARVIPSTDRCRFDVLSP